MDDLLSPADIVKIQMEDIMKEVREGANKIKSEGSFVASISHMPSYLAGKFIGVLEGTSWLSLIPGWEEEKEEILDIVHSHYNEVRFLLGEYLHD